MRSTFVLVSLLILAHAQYDDDDQHPIKRCNGEPLTPCSAPTRLLILPHIAFPSQ